MRLLAPFPILSQIRHRFFSLNVLPPGLTRALFMAGLVSSLTLVTAVAVFGPHLGPTALFGAMVAEWEADRPLWARLRCALTVSSVMTATMALGVLIAPYHILTVPVVVALILVMTTGYYSFVLTRGPGPLNLFYAAAIGSYLGQFGTIGPQVTVITGFAGLFAGFLTVLALIPKIHGPEERIVSNAEIEVTAFCAEAARDRTAADHSRRRHAAYAAVNRGWLVLRAAGGGPFGCRVAHLARMASVNRRLSLQMVRNVYPHITPDQVGTDTPALRGRPTLWWLFRANFCRDSVAWFTASRVGLAGAIAGVLTQALQLGHPYWAILSATLVLHRWIGRLATTTRALHRGVGTLLGLGIVAVILACHPGESWIIAATVVCIVVQFQLVARNYALGIIFVTPMALLSIEAAGQAGSVTRLMADRLIETLIGVSVAIAVTWCTSLRTPRRITRVRFLRSYLAIERLLGCLAAGVEKQTAGIHARVVLQYELLTTLAVLTQASEDDPSLASWHEVEVALADLGYATLCACWITEPDRLLSPMQASDAIRVLHGRLAMLESSGSGLARLADDLRAVRACLARRPEDPDEAAPEVVRHEALSRR